MGWRESRSLSPRDTRCNACIVISSVLIYTVLHPAAATPAEFVILSKAPKSLQHLSAVTLCHIPLSAPCALIENLLIKNFQLLEENCSPNGGSGTSFPCSRRLRTRWCYMPSTLPAPRTDAWRLFVALCHCGGPGGDIWNGTWGWGNALSSPGPRCLCPYRGIHPLQ